MGEIEELCGELTGIRDKKDNKMAYEKTWEVKQIPKKTLAEIIEK